MAQPSQPYKEADRLLSETQTGQKVSQHSWDADKSSAMDTLRAMIRERVTPTMYPSTLAQCIVVDAAPMVPPVISSVLGTPTNDEVIQPVRVRVLSDPRHYWMPEPQNREDPARGFHPIVLYIGGIDGQLKFGDVVDVEFSNPETQFTSHLDVGRVLKVLKYTEHDFRGDSAVAGFLGDDCRLVVSGQTEEATESSEDNNFEGQRLVGCAGVGSVDDYPAPNRIPPRENENLSFPTVTPTFPTLDSTVISPFSLSRTITVNGVTETRPHKGTDFRAPLGSAILASLDGTIYHFAQSEGAKGFGFYSIIVHSRYATSLATADKGQANLFFTLYAHMQNPALHPIIANGSRVYQGQIIGISANSGKSTGPHLHFEYTTSVATWEAANPVNSFESAFSSGIKQAALGADKVDPTKEFFGKNFIVVGDM
jgi:murein DD-endopeptidase MepM/ murein hydrolase activator NlpD